MGTYRSNKQSHTFYWHDDLQINTDSEELRWILNCAVPKLISVSLKEF